GIGASSSSGIPEGNMAGPSRTPFADDELPTMPGLISTPPSSSPSNGKRTAESAPDARKVSRLCYGVFLGGRDSCASISIKIACSDSIYWAFDSDTRFAIGGCAKAEESTTSWTIYERRTSTRSFPARACTGIFFRVGLFDEAPARRQFSANESDLALRCR